MSKKLMNTSAAAAAAAVVAVGGYLIGNGQSDSGSSAASSGTPAAQQGGPAFNGQGPSGGQGRPGFGPGGGLGSPVSGDAAARVEKAVTAKYGGSVERVLKLSDGSYLAHVITSNGEVRVKVSKAFDIVGTQQGPAGGPRAPGATS
jgi:hypothetical protein